VSKLAVSMEMKEAEKAREVEVAEREAEGWEREAEGWVAEAEGREREAAVADARAKEAWMMAEAATARAKEARAKEARARARAAGGGGEGSPRPCTGSGLMTVEGILSATQRATLAELGCTGGIVFSSFGPALAFDYGGDGRVHLSAEALRDVAAAMLKVADVLDGEEAS